MSKKSSPRTSKPLSPRAAPQVEMAHLVREDFDEADERPKGAAAAETATLNAPAPVAGAEPLPEPATAPFKPLAPLAALWPGSESPQGKSEPSRVPPPATPVPPPASKAAPFAAPQLREPPLKSLPRASLEKPGVATPASRPLAPKTVNVTFGLLEPMAKRVALCGDFNGWAPDATPMKRYPDGHWETTVALAPGRYEYKFVVGEEWIPDPLARENVWNDRGTLNSVIEVRA